MSLSLYRSTRACPVCGLRDAAALHEQRFALPVGSPLPSAYTVAACTACGACFADTPAPQDAYDSYYQQYSRYDDPALGSGGGVTALDRARLDETARLIASLPLARGRSSRVLDIGCAGGGLLQALSEHGFGDLTGLDPSPACVDRVRQQGYACHRGTFTRHTELPAAGSYELVILSHVAEHLLDVGAALQAIRVLLADGGAVYVEVPDPSRYEVETFVPFYFFDCEHINHFDRAALANLARVNGFECVEDGLRSLRVDGGGLYPAVWSYWRKGVGSEASVPDMHLRASLAAYVERSVAAGAGGPLAELATSQRPVLLWGAGQHAQRLLTNSALAQCKLWGIVDRDPGKQGLTLQGHKIRLPEVALAELPAEAAIVVASVLHGDQIAAEISLAGVRNPVMVAR